MLIHVLHPVHDGSAEACPDSHSVGPSLLLAYILLLASATCSGSSIQSGTAVGAILDSTNTCDNGSPKTCTCTITAPSTTLVRDGVEKTVTAAITPLTYTLLPEPTNVCTATAYVQSGSQTVNDFTGDVYVAGPFQYGINHGVCSGGAELSWTGAENGTGDDSSFTAGNGYTFSWSGSGTWYTSQCFDRNGTYGASGSVKDGNCHVSIDGAQISADDDNHYTTGQLVTVTGSVASSSTIPVPLAGLTVTLDYGDNLTASLQATTQADGTFQFQNVAILSGSNSYQLSVDAYRALPSGATAVGFTPLSDVCPASTTLTYLGYDWNPSAVGSVVRAV